MTEPARPRRWREVKGRPVQGNSPNDRILRGPDCNRPKRVYADSFPATPSPQPPRIEEIPEMRFSRHDRIYRSDWLSDPSTSWDRGTASRWSAPGPGKGRDGRHAPYPSSAMSSGRLFLDRVARQHCPSPLHRHGQNNMHPLPAWSKQDISTLQRIGHFYFALTLQELSCQGKVKMSPSWQSRNVAFTPSVDETHVMLDLPVKRRRALLASNPIEE